MNSLEQRKLFEMFDHPFVKILNICDRVYNSLIWIKIFKNTIRDLIYSMSYSDFENIGVFGKQLVIYNSPFVFGFFEVRIWIQKEHFFELQIDQKKKE